MSQAEPERRGMSKETARSWLDRLQFGIGILLVLCGIAGTYLLLTDGSLWNLALSHAVGLIVVVTVDFIVGGLSLFSYRRVYVLSLACAALGIVLQLGDIITAPQYYQTVEHFAGYLFGLWPFDLMLGVQTGVLVLGAVGRRHAAFLARRKSRRGKELEYSRRGFIRSVGIVGGFVALAALLSSIKLPVPSKASQTTTTLTGAPAGAIANVHSLTVGNPVYFEYPTGYPNMLALQKDGSLLALSMLCTHVCCQLGLDSANSVYYCPCHGSLFDLSGRVVQGPAGVDLPQVQLRTDTNGYVFPTGVSNPGPCQV